MTTKPGSLKVLNKPLGDDLRHDLIGVVDALAAAKRSANARAAARSFGSASVSLSASGMVDRSPNSAEGTRRERGAVAPAQFDRPKFRGVFGTVSRP